MRTIVIIPTYNEAQHIERLITQILYFHPSFEILVVDDNSPDGTGKAVERLAEKLDKVKVLYRPRRDGLGRAYMEGFKHVLVQTPPFERIIQMDADFSHQPKYLNDLLNSTGENSFAIGSRYIPGGRVIGWSLYRRLLSYFANLFVRLWLGIKVRDSTTGFRCFPRKILENIDLGTIKSKGYLFQIEVVKRCLERGYRLIEVPITFIERKKGKTKLGLYEIWEAFWGVVLMRFFKK